MAVPQIEVQSVRRFLGYLEKANGDERIAIDTFRKNSTNDVDRRPGGDQTGSTVATKKSPEAKKSSPVVNVGDVGYKFRKEFDSGWYNGTVVEVRPHAGKCGDSCETPSHPVCIYAFVAHQLTCCNLFCDRFSAEGGKDRRCVYEDGDCEDLSLIELQTLAILDPTVTKIKPCSSPKDATKPPESNDAVHIPVPRNGSVYTKSEAFKVLSSFPKYSKGRGFAIKVANEKGYIPYSERNIYKFLEKAERGVHIDDTTCWKFRMPIQNIWEQRFSELKEFKRKYG
jgi:hypothetical protein